MADATLEPRETDPDHERAGGFSRLLTRLFGRATPAGLRESIQDVLNEHEGESLPREERAMLLNVLSLSELRVDDIMVPRADIAAIEESASLSEVVDAFRDSSHSRMPIYRETLDYPIGIVHIKDLIIALAVPDGASKFRLSDVRRDALFVPPSMPVVDLLIKMQTTRIHLALVIDEYGGTDGLLTIEDLIEQIVGEIEDEHDADEPPEFVERPDGSYDVDARMEIEDFQEKLGLHLLDEEDEEDIDTVGGLVVSLIGRLTQRGEIVSHDAGLEFHIVDADPRRIKRVRVLRTSTGETPPDDG